MGAVAVLPIAEEVATLAPIVWPLAKQIILGVRHMFVKGAPAAATPPPNTGQQQGTVTLQTMMTALDQMVKTGVLTHLPQSASVSAIIEAAYQAMRMTGEIGSANAQSTVTAAGAVTVPTAVGIPLATVPIMATLSFGGAK